VREVEVLRVHLEQLDVRLATLALGSCQHRRRAVDADKP
jgi:hypothetical protein